MQSKLAFLRLIIFSLASASFPHLGIGQPQANKPDGVTQTPSVSGSNIRAIPGSYVYGGVNPKINYVQTKDAMGSYTDFSTFSSQNYTHVREINQYIDGLGRPIQSVTRQVTPGGTPKDLVVPVLYDEFGREQYKYLSYVQSNGSHSTDGKFKLDPFADQDYFFKTIYKDVNNNLMYAGEQALYSKTEFEPSELNRVVKSMAQGNTWAGANSGGVGVRMEYMLNTATEGVRRWEITNNSLTYTNDDFTNIPTSGSPNPVYGDQMLFKTITIDENGSAVVEYKNKDGQVILKKVEIGSISSPYNGHDNWLCTYYVYDDFGRLRFVIPPKVVDVIKSTWVLNNETIINELCFRYEYDSRGRMIAKKVPGAGWTYMLYDTRDRLVYTQDANMRLNNKWLAVFYDYLNRPIMTGMITYTGNPTGLQTYANSTSGATIQVNGENIVVSFDPRPPSANLIALTLTYYEHYAWTSKTYSTTYNSKVDAGNNLHSVGLPSSSDQQKVQTRGLVTGNKTRVIEDPADLTLGTFLVVANFYDDRSRIIQTSSDNYKQGTDVSINLYDFGGKILSNYLVHNNPAASISKGIQTNMEYDFAGRLLNIKKSIFDNPTGSADYSTTIVQNEYDDLGNLKRKKLGQKKNSSGVYTSDPIETLDYNYNIRGWLKGINKDYANAVGGSPERWFGMELNYDWGFGINAKSGNIGGVKWKSNGDDERRAFGYTYDKINRILGADFSQFGASNYADDAVVKFDMLMGDGQTASSAYDQNGNILAMRQMGLKLGSSAEIDIMTYAYYSNTNKLKTVTESGTGATDHKLSDFTDKNINGNDYGYDKNGNMISDLNKRLVGTADLDQTSGAIDYNHLNLPYKIRVKKDDGTTDKGDIVYIYDATGAKLEKRVNEITTPSTPIKKTMYIASSVYESVPSSTDALQFMVHEEGRFRPLGGTPTTWAFDYFIKDHLGNVRMVLTDEQKTDIYQAGMEEANRTFEVALFGDKVNITAHDKISGFDNNANNLKVSRLFGTTAEGRVGPGVILKVMAGDKIKAHTYAWYVNSGMDNSIDNTLTGIVNTILTQLTGGVSIAGKGTAAEQITSGVLQPGVQTLLSNQTPESGAPKAFLNWVLLDEEQFKAVDGNYGAVPIPVISGVMEKQLIQANSGGEILMKKNGYLYVYVSNESKGNVYFDDIRIEHIRGALLEESHYYPFGLTMASVSSKVLEKKDNKYKFNAGSEQNVELGLNFYDTRFRTFDPTLGSFRQIDPIDGAERGFTLYVYSGNNPITFNDPLGLKWKDSIQTKDGDWAYANNPWLASVTVRSKPKQYINYLSLPRMHKNQSQWNDEMIARQRDNRPLSQKGDPVWLKDQLPFHLRNYRAHQDFRKMSIGAVILIGSPVVVASLAGTSTGSILFNALRPKLQFNIVGGGVDLFNQMVIQGKELRKVNWAPVATNMFFGGSNILSSSIYEASGSLVTISGTSVGFNLTTQDFSEFGAGAAGNLLGNAWGGMFELEGLISTPTFKTLSNLPAHQFTTLPGEVMGNFLTNSISPKK